ncbi:MAG TPA: radical SAM protein [Thermodesulfovibrionales bacterium]|nr:radical SAM protein [Thermodesulfovibrionales bacterium]
MDFKPKWIAWEITRRCNLRCVHCRSSSEMEVQGHPDFSTEEAFRIIDDISSYAQPVMVLSGGEPLMRSDVFDIARYGSGKGLRMCLATNGTLITEEICGRIKDSGMRIVSLSLDGSTEEVHDDFRNEKGAFAGIVNAARLFRKHDIEFIINSSFTRRNQEEIPKVYRFAKELGATAWYMFMIVPTGRGEEIMNELISKEDYEEILEWHYQMEKEEHDMLVRPTCAPHYYRVVLQQAKEEGVRLERRTLKFSTGGSKGCIAGQLICLINVDGDVLPCSYFPKSAGNIKRQSFKDIWENSDLFLELRDFKRYKGRCGSCEYINVCGGCRARSYSVYGDYLEEEPFCGYLPVKMEKKKVARN